MAPMNAWSRTLLALAGLAAAGGTALAAPPDFSGNWRLDRTRSDDAKARIAEVAGSGQVKGGGTSPLTILPMPGTVSSVERVELHDYLMHVAEQLERLDIEQSATEIKLFNGDEVARTFYLDREHLREDLTGRKLKCRTKWKGSQLLLEESGAEGRHILETLTLAPEAGLLIQAVRFEDHLLKKPLELRLVYTREKEK
jgi:hypothetical protein